MILQQAIDFISQNAHQHSDKSPTLGTLLEEVAELARAIEGKHEHSPDLELVQIGGIIANMLCQYPASQLEISLYQRYEATE